MATMLVTGAFGYSGRHVAERLLAAGHRVRTLTRSMGREHPFGDAVEVFPLDFERPASLREALAGVDVFVNTYWVRFTRAGFSHAEAVRNTRLLFEAARAAGVGRVVHVSITNPSLDSPYSYFRGKAELEEALAKTGLPHTILRPAVLFGGADILLNNIAWMLRTLPVIGIFGDGRYKLQPIHVADFADLIVEEAGGSGARVVDAIGPETYAYADLVRLVGRLIGCDRRQLRVPRWIGLTTATLMGWWLRDVVLTGPEIDALMDGLLATDGPPTGSTRLSEWVSAHADTLGVRYAHELDRRRDRKTAYA